MVNKVLQREVLSDRTTLTGLAPGHYVIARTQGGTVSRSALVVQ